MTGTHAEGIEPPYFFEDDREFGEGDFEEALLWGLAVIAVIATGVIAYGVMRFRSKRRRP